jgi:hypothetical protein
VTAAAIDGLWRRATRSRAVFASALTLAAVVAAPASAQPAQPAAPAAGSGVWEVGGGAVFVGGYDLGASIAELTPNTGNTTPVTLFRTENSVRPVIGVQARLGYIVSSALVIEAGFRFARPVYEVEVTGDFESAADATIEERLSQYLFEGSAVWHFNGAAFAGGRAVPFVVGGAGYLRELHDEDAYVEDGYEYHAGAGVKWWFNDRRRGFGIRGEVGVSIRDGGFDFEDSRRWVPTAAGSLVYRF